MVDFCMATEAYWFNGLILMKFGILDAFLLFQTYSVDAQNGSIIDIHNKYLDKP